MSLGGASPLSPTSLRLRRGSERRLPRRSAVKAGFVCLTSRATARQATFTESKPQQTGTGLLIRNGEVATTSSLRPTAARKKAAAPELARAQAGGFGNCGLRLGVPVSSQMKGFHYVYILRSIGDRQRHYTGCTEDLSRRLLKHNNGEVPYTSKYRPWEIKTAIAFKDRERAVAFEPYLKSPSGRAFAKRRL